MNNKTHFDLNSIQYAGAIRNCLEIKTLVEKEYSKTDLVIDHINNFSYIVKQGNIYTSDEYKAYRRLYELNSDIVIRSIPKIYQYSVDDNNKHKIIMEYIDGHKGYELNKIDILANKNHDAWVLLLMQLALFIERLEQNKIQHNDFHLGNIIVVHDKEKKIFNTYIIDLETIVDYVNQNVYSTMVFESDSKEKIRMGWHDTFHIGSDLNQILGEILDKYHDIMPKDLADDLSKRIIKHDKEFPFAISEENKSTSGSEIMKMLNHKRMTKSQHLFNQQK